MGGSGATPIPNTADLPQLPCCQGKNAFFSVEMAHSMAKVDFVSVSWLDLTAPPAAELSGYRSEPAGNWQRNLAQGRTLDLTTWIALEQTETILMDHECSNISDFVLSVNIAI
jgi:hypothetical protein